VWWDRAVGELWCAALPQVPNELSGVSSANAAPVTADSH